MLLKLIHHNLKNGLVIVKLLMRMVAQWLCTTVQIQTFLNLIKIKLVKIFQIHLKVFILQTDQEWLEYIQIQWQMLFQNGILNLNLQKK